MSFTFLDNDRNSFSIEDEKPVENTQVSENEEKFELPYKESKEYKLFMNDIVKRFEIYKRQIDRDITKKIGPIVDNLENKIESMDYRPNDTSDIKVKFNEDKMEVSGLLRLPVLNIKLKKDIAYDLYAEELEEDEITKKANERWKKVYDAISEIILPIREEIFRDKEYHFKFGGVDKITGARKYRLWTTSVKFSFHVTITDEMIEKAKAEYEKKKGAEGFGIMNKFRQERYLTSKYWSDFAKQFNSAQSRHVRDFIARYYSKYFEYFECHKTQQEVYDKYAKQLEEGESKEFPLLCGILKMDLDNPETNAALVLRDKNKKSPEFMKKLIGSYFAVGNSYNSFGPVIKSYVDAFGKVGWDGYEFFNEYFAFYDYKVLPQERKIYVYVWFVMRLEFNSASKSGIRINTLSEAMTRKPIFSGEKDFSYLVNENNFSTEEKKLVMNKTIYTSSDKSDDTVKVDHLDKNQDLEKDAVRVMKSERDMTATLPLPLFRFEEKQKPQLADLIKTIVEEAYQLMKNSGAEYTPLVNYINIPKEKEIAYLLDLTVSRNSELFNSTPKELEIELVTCYYDKKLRVFNKIPEDELINKTAHPEYFQKVSVIRQTFKKFFEDLKEKLNLSDKGFNKDVELYIDDTSGSEEYGAGMSIFIKYNKPIDYSNKKRGKEDYSGIFAALDDDFAKSLEEQNSIKHELSIEAIADGMGENSDSDENEEEGDGEQPEDSLDDSASDDTDEFAGDDDMGGDESGDDMGDGEDSGEGGDSSSNSDSNSDMPAPPKQAGTNPFADINSRDQVTQELKELKSDVDKALVKFEPFKRNSLVVKMLELSNLIEDALKNTYTVKVEDSLIRYNLYLTQFEDLVAALKRSFEKQYAKKKG